MKSTRRKAVALTLLSIVGQALPPGAITFSCFATTESNGRMEPDLKVIARVYNYAQVEPAILVLAEGASLRVFKHAGLRIERRNISLSSARTKTAANLSPDQPQSGFPDVFLRISPSSISPTDRGETLGCALASSEGRPAADARVLFDRTERDARLGIAFPYQILGHAMPHEIGHLLLGPDAHSVTAIMRANWGTEDYVRISQGSLFFTPHQADLFRLAAQRRIRRQNATGFANTQSSGGVEPSLGIKVRVYNYADAKHPTLSKAEEEASRIYRDVGVELAWLDCPTSHAEEERYPACQPPLGSMAVDVRILSSPMAARVRSSREELGFALPSARAGSASAAWVDYAGVERLAESHLASCDQILGHAIAHEIGHLLLGPHSHSHNGIMRANWDRKYLEEASRGQLLFTRDQVRLIRADVQRRVAMWEGSHVR